MCELCLLLTYQTTKTGEKPMIYSIGSMRQIPPKQANQPTMSTEKKEQAQEILKEFSVDTLSRADATSIVASFKELGIPPSNELEKLMADNGFDAKNIGDMAEVSDSKTLRPPPQNNSVNSSEMVSFLEELLENYDTQLSDDDKDSILAAVQEKFGMNNDSNSLVNVKV